MSRNIVEAVLRLSKADYEELALIAKHDPDMIRDVARQVERLKESIIAAESDNTMHDILANYRRIRRELLSVASTERRCQKCGTETKGEEAWVNDQIWCHPCADAAVSPQERRDV